jgi:hypothetical protein
MAVRRFRVSNATYADVPLSEAEIYLVADDPLGLGLWTATGTVHDPTASLPREGQFVAENELGALVEGEAMLQVVGGAHGNPIRLTGRGSLTGAPPDASSSAFD